MCGNHFLPQRCQFRRINLDYVVKHVTTSLKESCLGPPEKTDQWIEDSKSNLLHRISKCSDCTMDQSQVKAALLEIGWRSLRTIAKCVDAQMRLFRDALAEPLTRIENDLFEQTYLMNRWFDLPLIILHDRFGFLKEAIPEFWNDPEAPDALAVVHTMLHYYSQIIERRREADRLHKRNRPEPTGTHFPSEQSLFESDIISSIAWKPTNFAAIAVRTAGDLGYKCDFEGRQFEAGIVEDQNDDVISFRLICVDAGFDEIIVVERKEFEKSAMEYMDEE